MAEDAAQLAPLDPTLVARTLANPPFVQTDGVINIRCLDFPSAGRSHFRLAPHYVYRSAELSGITEQGKSQLRALNIKKVFDLRSDDEMKKWDSPLPSIEGIDVIRTPVFKKEDYSPEDIAKRYELYATGKNESFMQLYSQILESAGEAFGTILRHIRDNPSEPFIFHCTAGKDRTGVLAAIILRLADVDTENITADYALTRIGREPGREMILARLLKEPMFQNNNQAALNLLTCRADTMAAFLDHFDEKYGGVDQYCKDFLGLTQDDLYTIKNNLLVPIL
ncbi:protein-tyrosine phosphatase-like protein [Flagelloscypha sp. PMI_526]|nr:protein-tyrosine phosphatase-like protein [Flagelloscypha sp. PMI_526]